MFGRDHSLPDRHVTRSAIEKYDRWIVFAIALIAAVIWYWTQPIVFTNDSFGYLGAAQFIAGASNHNAPYYRMPLFPLFLIVTGVAKFNTFWWFVLAQTAIGVVMVLVFYDGLLAYSRRAAFLATTIFTVTFVPFVYSKSVMTEQLYLFGLVLCLASGVRYIQAPTLFRLMLVVTSILIMMLDRVQGMLIGLFVIPFLLYCHPAQWRSIGTAASVIVIATLAYSLVYSAQVHKHFSLQTETSAEEPSLSNSVGKYLFTVPYLDAWRYFHWRIVEASNGPASAKLLALADYGTPTVNQWWAIWQTLDKKIGIVAANDLLLHATFEAVIAHPAKSAVLYGHNLIAPLYKINSPYVWEHPSVVIDQPSLNSEFKQSGDQSSVTWMGRILNPLFHAALIMAAVLVVITAGAHGPAWMFCLGLYGYNLLCIATSGAPEGRIVFYGLPLLLAALATARSRPWLLTLRRARRASA